MQEPMEAEGIGFPGAGLMGQGELSDMDARN